MIDIEQLKAANSLSSIVGQVVQLRPAGREWEGRCPFHDDKNPSFYVNDEEGYYCQACGAKGGDVIQFVMDYEKVGFREACEIIAGGSPLGFYSPPNPSKLSKAPDNGQFAREIWNAAQPIKGTIAQDYLANRGIAIAQLPETLPLRFAWLKHKDLPGERATLVAAFTNLAGEVTSIQRIYLTRDGKKLNSEYPAVDPKLCLGKSTGDAIKLGDGVDNIILAESLEDGLTLYQEVPDATVWCVAGAGKIAKVCLPDDCRTVFVAPDRDKAGLDALEKATAAFDGQGRAVAPLLPSIPFSDWNEQLLAEKRA